MSEKRFYHLRSLPVQNALPRLLEKTRDAGFRAVIKCQDTDAVITVSDWLWSYDPNSWLPHGTEKDAFADLQPIWITDKTHVPNQASVLFLIQGQSWGVDATPPESGFERIFDLFDGANPEAVQAARQRWSEAQRAGFALSYWQQSETGGWICQKQTT